MEHATPARFYATDEVAATLRPTSSLLLRPQLPVPQAGLQASVIIPAKDEARNLPTTLAAFASQVDLQGRPLAPGRFEIIVLANNCTDNTAAVVRHMARRFPRLALHVAEVQLPAPHAHVGQARRLLMDEACWRLQLVGNPTGFIASTDADTRVSPSWLAATMAEVAAGADAVGGRILTDAPVIGACPVRRTQLRDAAYRLLCTRLERLLDPSCADPWPSHHQHFGASLAVTARAYQLVGGLPVVPFLEDEALWQALHYHDLRLRHSPAVRVVTSGRQCGRVEVGLSWQLRQWARLSEAQQEPTVESPAQLAQLWQARRQLRECWLTAHCPENMAALAALFTTTVPELQKQLRQASTFGACWEKLLANRFPLMAGPAKLPLSLALVELRTLIAQHERQSKVA